MKQKKVLKEYQKKLSKKLYSKYKLNKKSFVIDIGSNDGTLLEGFKKKTKILGLEPNNTEKIANKNKIPYQWILNDRNEMATGSTSQIILHSYYCFLNFSFS